MSLEDSHLPSSQGCFSLARLSFPLLPLPWNNPDRAPRVKMDGSWTHLTTFFNVFEFRVHTHTIAAHYRVPGGKREIDSNSVRGWRIDRERAKNSYRASKPIRYLKKQKSFRLFSRFYLSVWSLGFALVFLLPYMSCAACRRWDLHVEGLRVLSVTNVHASTHTSHKLVHNRHMLAAMSRPFPTFPA